MSASFFLCVLWLAFGSLLALSGLLLVAQPLVDALADKLAHIFEITRRLFPKLLECVRVKSKPIVTSKTFLRPELVFVVRSQLTRRHCHHSQRTTGRQRFEDRTDAGIDLFQTCKHTIVLVGAKRSRVFFAAARPLGLQRHA